MQGYGLEKLHAHLPELRTPGGGLLTALIASASRLSGRARAIWASSGNS